MGDIAVIGQIVLRQRDVLITLGVGILVLAPVAMLWARRLRWSRTRTFWAGMCGASLALVPATTLARGDAVIAMGRSCGIQPGLSLSSPEAVLNVLLFAPAAFFGVLAVRRVVPIVVSALLCSIAVETVQLVTTLGTCQTGDVVRNVMGAVVAGGVAALFLQVLAPANGTSESARVHDQ